LQADLQALADAEESGRSVLIVPVRRGLDPYGFIGKYQAVQGVGKDLLAIADEARQILMTNELTATRMVAPTVRSFTQAGSYQDARKTFESLKSIPREAWTECLLDEIERGAAENQEILNAWYGNEILPEVVERFVTERRNPVPGTVTPDV
jgi:hypothetical protein